MAKFNSIRPQALPRAGALDALAAALQPWTAALSGEAPLVLALVVVGLVAHGLNMFNYPAFTLKVDEGIYAEQAWAVVRQLRLAPYTYFYDHAPGGWLLLAVWMALTGGPRAFGGVIDSGRVLMLLLHLGMVPLLYHLARKLGCAAWTAALVTLLFSISPLAVFYQRLVLLDNIMMFWLLLSLNLLLDGWGRLSRLALSGACFGLALLAKETAIVFLPAMLYMAVVGRWRHQGRFAVLGWLVPMCIVASWYPLYALLKGELFPAGGPDAHAVGSYVSSKVSLIDALRWQATRTGGGLLNLHNDFWQLVRTDWLPRDPLLFAGGAVACAVNLLRGFRDRRALAAGLLGALPLLYMGHGGIVFGYYVIAAVPLLCLNLGLLAAALLARGPRVSPLAGGVVAAFAAGALVVGYWQAGPLQPLYRERPGDAGRAALAWIKRYVPAESMIVARDDMWPDLHEPGPDGPAFPNVHSHYKVASDPAVRSGLFHDDWQTVDYLITVPDIEQEFQAWNNTVALEALQHAHLVKRWTAESGDARLHPAQVIELWKVDKAGATEQALLAASAAYMAGRFERDGAFASADGAVYSESQAYGLLRSVWAGDRGEFDRVWAWTQAHQLDATGLMPWLWRDGAVVDPHTATDADTDAALALLLAGQRWHDEQLLEAGRRMVQAIWEREVVALGEAAHSTPYVTAGDWATQGPVLALNPSYFSPYAYRIFKQVDADHDWWGVLNSGYDTLFAVTGAPLGAPVSAGLPPDWVGLDRATGELVPLQLEKAATTRYGYDAARTYWRVALDMRWVGDGRDEAFLKQAGFLQDEVSRKGFPSAVYEHGGEVVEEPPSLTGDAGALAALLTLDPPAAHGLYAGQIAGEQIRSGAGLHWGDADDLYAQEWGWFATALYANALPNLWEHPDPTGQQ